MIFTDVKKGDWFYDAVKTAYEDGLISGRSETVFDPMANLTYVEAIKLAACMHEKYTTGAMSLMNGTPWYQPYLDYCKKNGIITKDYNLTENVTRAGYMEIFAKALPDSALPIINKIPDGSIPDVSMNHPQAAAIYKLYRAGILQGSDEQHSCRPESTIMRCEVAAILTRMMYAENRIKFDMPGVGTVGRLSVRCGTTEFTVSVGDKISMQAEGVGGLSPYTFQWQSRYSTNGGRTYTEWKNVGQSTSGLKSSNGMTVTAGDIENKYQYRCVVTDSLGSQAASSAFVLKEKTSALTITSQPQDALLKTGSSVTFSVTVSGGKAPYSYLWYETSNDGFRWSYMNSERTSKLTVSKDTGMKYRCEIVDAAGNKVTTNTVSILKKDPLVITSQPWDICTAYSSTAFFDVTVSGGTKPYRYEWYYKKDSEGVWRSYNFISSHFVITPKTLGYETSYRCKITDADGDTIYSDSARIIDPTDPLVLVKQPEDFTTKNYQSYDMEVEVKGGRGEYCWVWYYRVYDYKTRTWTGWSRMHPNAKYTDEPKYIETVTVKDFQNDRNTYQYYCEVFDADGKKVTTDVVTQMVTPK